MIITLVHFLLGVASDLILCQPLRSPSDNRIFNLVDDLVDLSSIHQGDKEELKLSEVVR